MHFVEKKPEEKRIDLDNKLKSNKILRIPGAYNPLTAKVIEEIGYDGVYVSGGVMSNDLGYPDIGLTTLNDVSNRSSKLHVLQIFQQLLMSIQVLNLVKKLFKHLKILVFQEFI